MWADKKTNKSVGGLMNNKTQKVKMNIRSQVWNDATNSKQHQKRRGNSRFKASGGLMYFCSLREESKNFSTGICARTSGLHVVIFSPTNQTSKGKKKKIIHERKEVKV